MSKIITIPTVRKIDGQQVTELVTFQVVEADEWFAEQAYTPKPLPTQQSLDTLFEGVTRMRLLNGGAANGKALGTELLLELSDAPAIANLHRYLAIIEHEDENSFFHCMCMGEQALELYRGLELIATIGLHHGRSIRWDGWELDAELVDGHGLLVWLAEQGVASPLERYQESQRRAEQARQTARRWQEAMPPCLLPFWEQMNDMESGLAVFSLRPAITQSYPTQIDALVHKLAHLLEALNVAYSDTNACILALFAWYGSGKGRWSSYPAYESVATQLLLTFPTKQLVTALTNHPLTPAQLEGSARFLSSKDYRTIRYDEIQQIPDGLKQILLAYTIESSDEDKIKRAQTAFSD